jgi:hypothetical protein
MKPMLKALGTKRFKLRYDQLLSNVGFKFNLRRYMKEAFPNVISNAELTAGTTWPGGPGQRGTEKLFTHNIGTALIVFPASLQLNSVIFESGKGNILNGFGTNGSNMPTEIIIKCTDSAAWRALHEKRRRRVHVRGHVGAGGCQDAPGLRVNRVQGRSVQIHSGLSALGFGHSDYSLAAHTT